MNVKNAFEILRLKPEASVADLKLAYRDMVDVWHPDRFLHNPRLKEKAQQQLQEINRAYEIALAFISSDAKAGMKDENGVSGVHCQSRPDEKPVRKTSKRAFSMPAWLARFLARFADGIIFALVLGYVDAFQLVAHPLVGWPTYVFAATLLWAFVEANLISSIGTTPGKWLLGLHVITLQGKRPDLLGAFKRSIGVWWYGLGAGLVPVMPVMMAVNCVRLIKYQPVRWDRTGPFVVILDPRGYLKMSAVLVIIALGCWLLIL